MSIAHVNKDMYKRKQKWIAIFLIVGMLLGMMGPEVAMAESNSDCVGNITTEGVMAGAVEDDPPLLAELTSTPASFTEGAIYCINNKYCGKYLAYDSSQVVPKSGTVGGLYLQNRWVFEAVGSLYAIRLSSSETKYLGVIESLSSSSVEVVTVTDGNIPNRCLWNITIASGGGCLIQNTYNSNYLCSYGTSIYTASLGTVGTSAYTSKVWRIILKDQITDLTSSTTFFNNHLVAGYTYVPRYRPATATWSAASDFTYSGYSTSVVSISSDGTITAKAAGTTTVTVQHKVTGLSFSFQLTVYTPGTCLGSLTTWCNSEEDRIGKWPSSPIVYYQKLNENSSFYFSSGFSTALSQWRTALGLSLSTTSSESSADIVSYGGTVEELVYHGFDESLTIGGLACVSSSYCGYYTMSSSAKACFEISDVTMYIVDYSGRTLNGYRSVVTHEMGHALGFMGHTSGTSTVMYPYTSENYSLTTSDKSELQQVYN